MPLPRLSTSNPDGNPWTNAGTARDAWHLTTEARRVELLNVLPPICVTGGFAVSEPIRHDADGRAVYLCVAEAGGSVWVRELARADMPAAIAALRAAVPARFVGHDAEGLAIYTGVAL